MFSYNICLSDERDDQGLDIRLKAKLLDEVFTPDLNDSLHDEFQNLGNKIERKVSFLFHVHVNILRKSLVCLGFFLKKNKKKWRRLSYLHKVGSKRIPLCSAIFAVCQRFSLNREFHSRNIYLSNKKK